MTVQYDTASRRCRELTALIAAHPLESNGVWICDWVYHSYPYSHHTLDLLLLVNPLIVIRACVS